MTEREVARLRRRLQAPRPSVALPEGFRRAAVLVPLLVGGRGAELLFTVRSSSLRHHAGQIAFPGGAVEAGETVEDAARREAWEEVGLVVPEDAIVGRLGELPSPAGYLATPVVAVLPAPAGFRLDPREVDEVFAVPLEELRTIAPTTELRPFRGATRLLHRYAWRDRDIWGFTGNVLRQLLTHLTTGAGEAAGKRTEP